MFTHDHDDNSSLFPDHILLLAIVASQFRTDDELPVPVCWLLHHKYNCC